MLLEDSLVNGSTTRGVPSPTDDNHFAVITVGVWGPPSCEFSLGTFGWVAWGAKHGPKHEQQTGKDQTRYFQRKWSGGVWIPE